MPKTKFSTNGTKPEIDTEEIFEETLPEETMGALTSIETNGHSLGLEIPKPSINPSVKLEGLELQIKPANGFSEETINSLIALSESLGIDPEVAVAKILDAVFGDNPNLITLYKQIAVRHREKAIKAEINKIEQLKVQKQRELSAIELELQHRANLPPLC